MLKLEKQESPLVTILRCSGRVVRGREADALLTAVMSEDNPHFLIDLSGVSAIDAAGLGVLAELQRWARDSNRTISLANPSKPIRYALDITGLSLVLQIYPATTAQNEQHGAV